MKSILTSSVLPSSGLGSTGVDTPPLFLPLPPFANTKPAKAGLDSLLLAPIL